MQKSILSDLGPSVWATYRAPTGATQRIKGVYESPYKKQTPQDVEAETSVTSQDPRFGVRISDFSKKVPLTQNAEIVLDDEPGCRYKVLRLEDTTIGWVDCVLEKI